MATVQDIPALAQQASSLTGLDPAFTQALIVHEGTIQGGSNNPFDVTQTWAGLAGFGSWVTGLWNSVGVAIFSDAGAAVQAWAQGINTFSNYAQFRTLAKTPGSTSYDLALALAKTGYSGCASGDVACQMGFANSISNLVAQIGPKQPLGPLGPTVPGGTGAGTPVPVPTPSTPPATGACPNIPGIVIDTPLGSIKLPDTPDIGCLINQAVQSATTTATDLARGPLTAISNVNRLLAFLENPQTTIGGLLIVAGLVVTVLGIILFGISLLPKGTRLPTVPVPA